MNRKMLFVAMPDSPHTARWIELIADQGWDLHLFPVNSAKPHDLLRNITLYQPWRTVSLRSGLRNPRNFLASLAKQTQCLSNNITVKNVYPVPVITMLHCVLSQRKTSPLGESDVCAPLPYGPHVLARVIKQLKPALIHSMEFQHAGYNVLRAKQLIPPQKFPKWLATNWGSDIFYYRQFGDHNQQIKRLLNNIDYYSCECERDITIAQEMGLRAKTMPVFPNTGGFNLDHISTLRQVIEPAARRLIMIKGYQHFAGRALTALDALLTCVDILQERNYQVIIFSPSAELYGRVEEIRQSHNLTITILASTSHERMLALFAETRIYLGVSVSDAISTSMLEAMAMGAFPIQTNTSCCQEWIEDGVSGFSIPPDDVGYIGNKLRQALTDDTLLNRASAINWHTVCARLDQRLLRQKEIAFYDAIFNDIEQSNKRL